MKSIASRINDLEQQARPADDEWLVRRMAEKRERARGFDWASFAEHLTSMLIYAARPTLETPRERIHQVVHHWHTQMRHGPHAIDEPGAVDENALAASIDRETDRIASMEPDEWARAVSIAAGRHHPGRD